MAENTEETAVAKRVLATKTGKRVPQAKAKIVRMRTKSEMSWAAIGDELGIAPRTVRRIFDEAQGPEAHFASRLPGKGGRTRATEAPEAQATEEA